jgi:hypothetical protein
MMRLITWLLAAAVLIAVAPTALADSFQFSINSSVTESIENTNNDNYMGIYQTLGWGTGGSVRTDDHNPANSPISNISFSVPTGNIISSAELYLIFPSPWGTGPAEYLDYTTFGISPPDPSNPIHIAPTLNSGGVSVVIDSILVNGNPRYGRTENGSLIFDLSNLLTIDGNNGFSSNLQNLRLLGEGQISIQVSGGYNWAGYIGGSGHVDLPYTLEASGTYSPVPEPSSIVLLGTGALGLAGVAHRRLLS